MFLLECSVDILWILEILPRELEIRRSNTRSSNGPEVLSDLKHGCYGHSSENTMRLWCQIDIDHMRPKAHGLGSGARSSPYPDNYFKLYIKVLDQSAC